MGHILVGRDDDMIGESCPNSRVIQVTGNDQQSISVGKCVFDGQLIQEGNRRHGEKARFLIGPAPYDNQVNGTSAPEGNHVLLTNTPTAETLRTMARHTLATGTSRFLPTMITSEFGEFLEAFEACKSIPVDERNSLGIEGIHIEGRWIDVEKKGIHNPDFISDAMTKMECDKLCEYAGEGILRMLTISPTKVTPEQIRQLSAAGIIISLGHTIASFEQVQKAVEAGAKHITHLGDAMTGEVKTRGAQSGLVDFALCADGNTPGIGRVVSSIICDRGVHIEDPFFRVVLATHQAYGNGELTRLGITTDAATYPANQDFTFQFGKRGATVTYTAAENKCSNGETGTLGGASTTMQLGIARLLELGVPRKNALHMAGGVFDTLSRGRRESSNSLENRALYDAKTLQIIGYFRGNALTLLSGHEAESIITG